jgi:hypothetical protein
MEFLDYKGVIAHKKFSKEIQKLTCWFRKNMSDVCESEISKLGGEYATCVQNKTSPDAS